MTIVPSSIDYTELDHAALEARIFRIVDGLFPAWTSRERIDFGNVLVGLLAYVGDRLAFYQDNQANEAFLTTAQLRRNIIAIAKRLGYRPPTAGAATVDLTFTLPSPAVAAVPIAKGRRTLTAEVTDPIAFQLLEDVVIPAGQTTATGRAEHSETRQEVFASSGRPNQAYQLRFAPFLDDSLELVAADGVYTVVEDMLSSRSTDRHVTVTVDDRDRAVLRFGNGTNGSIPVGSITATYKTGGGPAGNIEQNRLRRLEGTVQDALGNPVRVSVTNPLEASGGRPRESNAQIKYLAPKANRVTNAAVSREDYEIVAETVPGVARALHMNGQAMPSIGENQGLLLIVPHGFGAPSQALLDRVKSRFEPVEGYPAPTHRKLNTYQLVYAGAPVKVIDWSAVVYLRPNTTRTAARAAVVAAIEAFHALETTNEVGETERNERIAFGYYASGALVWSDAFNVVRDAAGIAKVDPGATGFMLNGERDDVMLLPQEFPVLGTITLIDGASGDAF